MLSRIVLIAAAVAVVSATPLNADNGANQCAMAGPMGQIRTALVGVRRYLLEEFQVIVTTVRVG